MRVLALDTTTRAGSVALVEDDRVVLERAGDASRTHAERLPLEIQSLLTAAGIELSSVDLFAIASGPGSFTGLRIGIATVQGFAFVHRRKVAPISALEALAHIGSEGLQEGGLVAAWMDAQRRDVFTAFYRVGTAPMFDPQRLTEVDGPAVGFATEVLNRWSPLLRHSTTFIGDGAIQWSDAIRQADSAARILGPPLLAGALGRLAVSQAASVAIDPAAVRPLYVRRPDAEIERDARDR